MNLAKISIRRPTFITAIIVSMLIVGFICMQRMSVNMFPDVNYPYVLVTTVYPGAAPQELETLVSRKIEEQISAISGLKNVYSISQDGYSIVFGEFTLETDPKYAEQQVKDKVAVIRNELPDGIEEPIIQRFDPADLPVMIISLNANLPPAQLYDLADTMIKNGLEQVANVSKVEIVGGTKREIHVDLDRNRLKDYDTSVTMTAGRIIANSQNVPVGEVTRGATKLAFRSLGEFRGIQQIQDVIVSFFGSDVPVTLSKIGTVTDGVEEMETKSYLNGKSALILNVYKQSGANTVAVSDNIIKRIEKLNKQLKNEQGAPGLVLVHDGGRPVRMNLKDVKETIFEGILLAILVVYLFLGNIRSTIITVIALPNSLIGAFIFMYLSGFSVNMLTLMALSLAVGLLIDDAIVVRENIFRHMEMGEPPIVAAQKGTNEVMLAVIATTLTVIAVFLPVGFLQGMVGQFFKEFGLTVVFAMVISLFDALTTAPMLSAYLITNVREKEYTGLARLIHLPAQWFEVFYKGIERLYEKVMHVTLRHKIRVIVGSLLIFVASLALVKGIPKTFMGTNEFGEFLVSLEGKPGTSLPQMEEYSRQVENMLRKEKDVEMVMSTIGNTSGESNVAQIFVKMVPAENRKRSTGDMKEYVRKMLVPYKDTMLPTVDDYSMTGHQERPFNLMLKGNDLDQLSKIADQLVPKLTKVPGLVDVVSNCRPGKPEFQVKFDPNRMIKLGVLSTTAGMELRGMVEGITTAKYRENGQEYDIRVRLQEDQRDLSREFDQLYVPNVNNQLVKLMNIAEPVSTTGPSKIYRRNRERYIMIEGNTAKNGAIGDITAAATKMLKQEKLPANVSYEFLGQSEDMADLFKNMIIAAGLSIIFIYLVLASLYESLVLPFTIMLALPLAIVGGLIAIYITGQTLGMFTMIGFIMLLGLVTKNSILLVDYTQRLMRKGLNHDEALIKAGLARLRPILMTTFALIAGMLPLALGLSEVGKFRVSMGIAIIGGLLSSTALTLIIIPAVFEYMDTFRLWTRKLLGRPPTREIDKDEDDTEVPA